MKVNKVMLFLILITVFTENLSYSGENFEDEIECSTNEFTKKKYKSYIAAIEFSFGLYNIINTVKYLSLKNNISEKEKRFILKMASVLKENDTITISRKSKIKKPHAIPHKFFSLSLRTLTSFLLMLDASCTFDTLIRGKNPVLFPFFNVSFGLSDSIFVSEENFLKSEDKNIEEEAETKLNKKKDEKK